MKKKDSIFVPIIITLSVVVPIAVALLMIFPDFFHIESNNNKFNSLPFFHAVLNGATAVLLFVGYVLIKNKKTNWHKISMISAFVLSAIFLVSYVVSKLFLNHQNSIYEGEWRMLYLFILITHIILSVPVLPLAMFSIYRGMTGEINRHKKIVKWTFPVWMYVAITGVLVYVFMAPYY
ncbi:MAG: hypothetical protein CMD06_03660 [Flavobacteriales bacterium]|nr:hypothetical protein [Flavobacteriales bacterium]|tara:strand:- start:222 stop:755 length:534 start_codon:yes stop_codon:yes gene_type:complete